VAIGDIGATGGVVHIGDEAMFAEFVAQARMRSVEVVGVSADPSETRARHGVSAIRRIGFDFRGPDARAAMDERMARVLAAVDDPTVLDPDDPARDVIDAIRGADGLAIAGGGNLASNWPMHIRERSTLAAVARKLGKPIVISGQTLGPELTDGDSAMLGELLRTARVVGVREQPSHELALSLGVDPAKLQRTVDDATFVADDGAAEPRAAYCLVSFSLHLAGHPRDGFVALAAALLDELVSTTGLEVVFFAHFGSTDPAVVTGDSVIHREIATAMTQPSAVVAPSTVAAAAGLARNAAFVVSSRYHPVVFSAAAGVPTLAISVDAYTAIKLRGALATGGQRSVVALDQLDREGGSELVRDLWSRRAQIGAVADERRGSNLASSGAWWDRVFSELGA
jgi:polysaccharide pyruvyl transferase WcaK-like protein